MLHGRTNFELNGGVRHLEGCYTNLCEFRSRAQVLENIHGNQTLIQKVGNRNGSNFTMKFQFSFWIFLNDKNSAALFKPTLNRQSNNI